MEKVIRSTPAAWIALLVFVALCPQAEAQNPPGPEGWERLFNGKDLTGWEIWGTEKWSVDDGTILGESGPDKDDGFLMTNKTYKDFHAFLRFKCETNTNSGFFYHTTIPKDISKITFIQVEIDNQPGHHTAGLHANDRSWIVWPAQEKEFYLRSFDWNELLVKVEGKRTRTYLNGIEMVDFTYPKPHVTEGILALQIHPGGGSRVRFKDVWVRDLSGR